MDPCPQCDNQGAYPIRAARADSPPLPGLLLGWFYAIRPCECGRPSELIAAVTKQAEFRRALALKDLPRALAA